MSADNFSIVRVSANELAQIHAIEQRAHSHPWPLSQFENRMSGGSQLSWCVKDTSQKVLAYCFISKVVDQAELLNIAVDPDFQGKGIGAQLMQYFLDALPEETKEVFLEVRESNASAIALYDNLGFNQVGVRSNYYPSAKGKEDALLFALSLSF